MIKCASFAQSRMPINRYSENGCNQNIDFKLNLMLFSCGVTYRLLTEAGSLESGKEFCPPFPVCITRGTGRKFIRFCRSQGVHRFLPNQDEIFQQMKNCFHIHHILSALMRGERFWKSQFVRHSLYSWISRMGNIVSRESGQKKHLLWEIL